MYLEYFGLTKQPFGITPDTSLFFEGAERGDILNAVLYALNSGEGIIKVVGEVGSGKTMLSRMLANKASDNTVFVFLLNPNIHAEQVLYAIAHDLGLRVDSHDKSIQILHVLQQKLLDIYKDGKKVVLVIDEAQQMPLSTLEEIRLLSNLETETEKLLQIILFGQPELDEHIDTANVRQLRERITYSFYLSALNWQMADTYLHFRLKKAGHQGRAIFTTGAIKLLTRYANGTLRRLNVLADKSLLAAFLEKSPVVNVKHVKVALKDSTKGHKVRRVTSRVLFIAAFIILLAIVGYYMAKNNDVGTVLSQKTTIQAVSSLPTESEVKADLLSATSMAKHDNNIQTKRLNVQDGLLHERMLAFNVWKEQTKGAYTIRLMSAPSGAKNEVEKFVVSLASKRDKDHIYIKQTLKGAYIVYYRDFVGYSDASLALSELPQSVKKYQPYVSRIGK